MPFTSSLARKASKKRWAAHRERQRIQREKDARWMQSGGFVRALDQFIVSLRDKQLFAFTGNDFKLR